MAATMTSRTTGKPKENIDKTMADCSGCGSGTKHIVMAPNNPAQLTGDALTQMPPTELADKPTIGADSTKEMPKVDGIPPHPNSADELMVMAELKDPPGNRAAAHSVEDAPDSHGQDRETGSPVERQVAIAQQGDMEIGSGQSQATPGNNKISHRDDNQRMVLHQ